MEPTTGLTDARVRTCVWLVAFGANQAKGANIRTWQWPLVDLERAFYRMVEVLGGRLHTNGDSELPGVDPLASPSDRR